MLNENTTTAYTDDGNVTVPAGTKVFEVDGYGNVKAGPNELLPANLQQSSATWIGDFVYSSNSRRVYARSLVLREVGDPVDLAIGRTGGTRPLGPPVALEAGSAIGRVYFQGWNTGGQFGAGAACMYARSAEQFTPYAQGASLTFAVTQVGTTTMRDALSIQPDGTAMLRVFFGPPGSGGNLPPNDGMFPPALLGPGLMYWQDGYNKLWIRRGSGQWVSVQLS